ncbi:D-2-hydroxyacid dehydrogenase [Geminisphaera colitermitum]|uniref:D-2-hydroxyacid dehydrogenase n=1 Tax=Geminisphaera colitermitum TaxID=1148786 RepID=UPI000158D5AA|nr:D-2-hydroxyacid dehydrogenase [Geminisphaera colitermitum]
MSKKLKLYCSHDAFYADAKPRSRFEKACAELDVELTWRPQNTPETEARALINQSDIVLGWPEPDWVLASNIAWFQCGSTGFEKYVGKGLETKPRFTMCNSAGTMSIPVAEHGVALMLAGTRHIGEHAVDQTKKHFERRPPYREVFETTACVCGLGNIGSQVARLCHGLGMNVIGVDIIKTHPIAKEIFPLDQLAAAVAKADHIFIVLPLTPQTTGIFNKKIFDAMRPGAGLYALARGAHYVIDDLVAALKSGQVGFAGLDVFTEEPLNPDSPLWTAPNCLITPHASGRSVREHERLADLAIENLKKFKAGEPLRNTVMKNP